MAVKTDPILGLKYEWSGDDRSGYGPQMDANLLALGAVSNLAVIDRDLSTPPASPADGDRYIVGPSATGAWAGKENNVAIWRADLAAWEFYSPGSAVFYAYIEDEQVISIWDSAASQWTSGLGVSDKDSAKVARTIKPPSDADYTLTDLENAADIWLLDLSNWTVQRTLTVKDQDRIVRVINASAVKATLSSSVGSTVEVANDSEPHDFMIRQGDGLKNLPGAIVEFGSNANGNYVRWASGVQICWSPTLNVTPDAATSSGVSSCSTGARAAWTYPAEFIGAPACSAGLSDSGGNSNRDADCSVNYTANTYASISGRNLSGLTGEILYFRAISVGYWK